VGGRTQADAHRLVDRVKQVLAIDSVPVFTSDRQRQYYYALTTHFGQRTQRRDGFEVVMETRDTHTQFLRKVLDANGLVEILTEPLNGLNDQPVFAVPRGLLVDG
jgi:hypothetical protein